MGSTRAVRRSQDRRTGLRLGRTLSILVAGVLLAGLTTPALADEDSRTHGVFPTDQEVAAAEQRVADRARDVGAIRASLLLANQRLEAAAVAAEMAAEEYHGAMWRLGLAEQELAAARREAAASRRTLAIQRDEIGALVASSYQDAGQLTALHAFIGADGPEAVLDQYVTFQGVSDTLQAGYDRYAASYALARSFREHAVRVRVKAEALADEARESRRRAEQAAAAAQLAAAGIAAEKDRLIRELAEAQDISVFLARRRQAALEEIARERAAARARAEAEEAARQAAQAQAEAQARDRAEAERRAREQRRAAEAADQAAARAEQDRVSRDRATTDRTSRDVGGADAAAPEQAAPTREAAPQTISITPQPASPPPAPAPPPSSPPPGGSGGATQAIAFAKAQLGEPYVWGAAGPDAWDCSGLMVEAWARAGVSLPHYSVAQYYAGTPITVRDLRPGDLVFWSTTSSPESIHHVAMYLGDGQIVHAPRTGRPVSVDSLYYWTPPNFFARV